MTTLRREIRKKILDILNSNIDHVESEYTLEEIAIYITDAILKIIFKDKDKKDEHTS